MRDQRDPESIGKALRSIMRESNCTASQAADRLDKAGLSCTPGPRASAAGVGPTTEELRHRANGGRDGQIK